MTIRHRVTVVLAGVTLGLPAAHAAAQPITVVNPGFETGPLSDGQFAPFAFGWVSGGSSGTAGATNPLQSIPPTVMVQGEFWKPW